MAEPAQSSTVIPLYRVLVEEYNHQHPDAPLSLDEIVGQAGRYAEEYDRGRMGEEDPEARRVAVESGLVKEFYRRLHERRARRSALCISGGGIRSATFGLGLLQGFARAGMLGRFDFLSTVSGGGYVGSWLSAWIEREGTAQVEEQLRRAPRSPLSPEPEPVSHLRSYSRYMSPRFGLLSADTWTLVAIFFRNLFLNWLVLLPLLAAFLMVPRLSVLFVRQTYPPSWVPPLVLGLGTLAGIVSLAYMIANRPSLADPADRRSSFPEALKGQGWFLSICLLPLIAMAVAATLWWAWVPIPWERLRFDVLGLALSPLAGFILFGTGLHLGGYLLSRVWVRSLAPFEVLAVLATGALGGIFAWLAAKELFPLVVPGQTLELYVCFAAPLLLFLFLLAAIVFVGLASKHTDDADREWLARSGAWVLISIFVRASLASLVVFGPLLWHWLGMGLMSAVGGAAGLATLGLGGSAKSGAAATKRSEPKPVSARLISAALSLAAPFFALSIVVALSFLTSLLIRGLTGLVLPGFEWPVDAVLADDPANLLSIIAHAPGRVVLGLSAGLLALSGLMGSFVDINRFSLHAAYRDRLIRAYLGASRSPGTRKPNPFTGFDEADNLAMRDLAPNRPLHVVNVALNLVHGEKLAWQDRKAETFTFSPLHSGSFRLGYRTSDRYALYRRRGSPISLGTALAISGAAASPNMGYHSSPVVTFLLALWNVRLGWWLGNPGPAGDSTYDLAGPRFSPRALLAEAFGLTSDQHPWVYLSDGGHFENLALYEMVLRRCHFIVVSDGGQDAQFGFEDLGNAISKIRIDLGVPIEFERVLMLPRDLEDVSYDAAVRRPAFPYCALGRIRYSCVDYAEQPGDLGPEIDGWILYIKPSLNGTEPVDVFHYAKLHPEFPHESTANQLYTEAQFESYRALGSHVILSLTRGLRGSPPSFEDLMTHVARYIADTAPPAE
jgi:patatin-like phospholipase